MKLRVNVRSVGLTWGLFEGGILFLSLGVGSVPSNFEFATQVGLLSVIPTSFISGYELADFESAFKALLTAGAVAIIGSILSIVLLGLPGVPSQPPGTWIVSLLLLYFLLVGPAFFLPAFVVGWFGSVLGGRAKTKRQARLLRPLHRVKLNEPKQ